MSSASGEPQVVGEEASGVTGSSAEPTLPPKPSKASRLWKFFKRDPPLGQSGPGSTNPHATCNGCKGPKFRCKGNSALISHILKCTEVSKSDRKHPLLSLSRLGLHLVKHFAALVQVNQSVKFKVNTMFARRKINPCMNCLQLSLAAWTHAHATGIKNIILGTSDQLDGDKIPGDIGYRALISRVYVA